MNMNFKSACCVFFSLCTLASCSREPSIGEPIDLSLGEFSSQIPLDDFEVLATLTNHTSFQAKIHGVEACCNLRLDKARSTKSIAPNSKGELVFTGTVPDWEKFDVDYFGWKGKIFLETEKGSLLTVPFSLRMQNPRPHR